MQANELKLHEMLLHQKPVRLLVNICTLAFSNMLILFSSQRNDILGETKEEGYGRFRFTCSSWQISCYSDMSAVAEVYGHLETTTKCSSPNVNITPTTTAKTFDQDDPCAYGRGSGNSSHLSYTSAISALIQQSCFLKWRRA